MRTIITLLIVCFCSSANANGKSHLSLGVVVLSSSDFDRVSIKNDFKSIETSVGPNLGNGFSLSFRGGNFNSNILIGPSFMIYQQIEDVVVEGGVGFHTYGKLGNHVLLGFVMDFSFYHLNMKSLKQFGLNSIWGISLIPRFRVDVFPAIINYDKVNFGLFAETGIEFLPWAGSSNGEFELSMYQVRPMLNLGLSFM